MQIQANGIRVNYELSGQDDAPMVVMSHSLGSSLAMWNPQLAALEAKYRVLRYDTRGHGGTEVTAGAYNLNQLGDDVIALMDALGIDKAHWIGLSMGGMIGQDVALRYPDRFLSFSLCDTMAMVPEAGQAAWKERITIARDQGIEALVDSTMERWFTAPYREQNTAGFKLIRDEFLATAVDGFCGCAEAIRGLNYLERLGEIKQPTLIVVGEEDMGTPVAASEAIHERIAGSKLVIIPAAAHMSNVEQAQAFEDAVVGFLGQA